MKRKSFANLLRHHSGVVPAPPAPTAGYLHTSSQQIFDSTNTAFRPKGAQWVGFNKAGTGYDVTPPYTENRPYPGQLHGDAWTAKNTYAFNLIRIGISWDQVERVVPTALGGGLYSHPWTADGINIDRTWDTPALPSTGKGYLASLDDAILDLKNQGIRVILELQQSQWSPGCDPVQGAGMPRWLYSTATPGAAGPSDEVSAAKWEFFQASGGWARPGVPGPPQDLLADFWKLIIDRYKTNDYVVGIDFLNEPGWPTSHPVPGSPSAIANPSAPTDVTLVAFYNKMFTVARAIQPLLLLIYENGTYANKVAGRSPLTSSSTPPSGTNCVMSWHYYPTNPNNGTGPSPGNGTAPTLANINTFRTYLSDMVTLAKTTFGHAFWIGETSLFAHIENQLANREFDYPDTPSLLNTSYSLWEALWRDFDSTCATNNVGWAIWAFQKGAGRSLLNTDGSPKTDMLSAFGLTPDPPGGGGPASPISWATIGSNVYAAGDSHWTSPRWFAQYYDSGLFGRVSKTTPTQVLATTDITITSDGTLAGTTIAGTTFGTGFIKSGSDGAVVITCNAQCNSLTVTGPTNPVQLLITGKLWCVNKNGTGANTLADYNAAFNQSDPGGFLNITNATVAFTNYYSRCASGQNPSIRLNNCRAKDATTPYFDGFCTEWFTRDWMKPGSGTLDLWLRHGTLSAHPYATGITDPTQAPYNLPLFVDTSKNGAYTGKGVVPASLDNPPLWDNLTTYAQYQVVAGDTTKTPFKYYSVSNGNVNHAVPNAGLGISDANWQFFGDLHSDGVQGFVAYNTQNRAIMENVFAYQTNHAAIYIQEGTKQGTYWDANDYQWDSAKAYKVADNTATSPAGGAAKNIGSPDLVRSPLGSQYKCVADNINVNPDTDNGTNWALASGHNMYAQWCLFVGNAEAIANGCEDPTNGARDSLFARSFKNVPVQGTGGGHKQDGINLPTPWVTDPGGVVQIRGILNKNNAYADTNSAIEGSS